MSHRHFTWRAVVGSVFLIVLLAMGPSPVAGRDGAAAEVPQRIDLDDFPGEFVDEVVVPIPAEIFAVLDKLGDPDWSGGIVIPPADRDLRVRALLALTFGSLVGEGFIAVQARSSDDIEKIGRRVLELSESLGLVSAVRPHSLSIIEAAGNRDWGKVREELDSTQQTVRTTMMKVRDDELAELVSLGGWLRGTNVVTVFIGESYSADKAELLNQPGLIAHFREFLKSMEDESSKRPEIRAISEGLAKMEKVVADGDDVSEEDVNRLRGISRSMLEEYYFEVSAGEASGAAQ